MRAGDRHSGWAQRPALGLSLAALPVGGGAGDDTVASSMSADGGADAGPPAGCGDGTAGAAAVRDDGSTVGGEGWSVDRAIDATRGDGPLELGELCGDGNVPRAHARSEPAGLAYSHFCGTFSRARGPLGLPWSHDRCLTALGLAAPGQNN